MQTVEFTKIDDMSSTMRESMRALRTNIQFCGDDIRTILFSKLYGFPAVCRSAKHFKIIIHIKYYLHAVSYKITVIGNYYFYLIHFYPSY